MAPNPASTPMKIANVMVTVYSLFLNDSIAARSLLPREDLLDTYLVPFRLIIPR
jgi:hypothetical protein